MIKIYSCKNVESAEIVTTKREDSRLWDSMGMCIVKQYLSLILRPGPYQSYLKLRPETVPVTEAGERASIS